MIIVIDVIKKIKNLQIQGARRISIESLKAISKEILKIDAKNRKSFLKKVHSICKKFAKIRPTEPALRNSLAYFLIKLEKCREENVNFLKKEARRIIAYYLEDLDKIHERVAEIAARRIPNNSKILTHCHSTTVELTFKKALDFGKKFEVIATETRPINQGYITAKNLAKYGIQVTLIVDSAMRYFMKECNLCIIGADVIAANGAVINKIGSSILATIAKELNKKLIVVSGLYKFDPLTIEGFLEPIEERNPKEIIGNKKFPKNVKIRNIAFDAIAPEKIDAIITEAGVLMPYEVKDAFFKRLNINEEKFIKKLKWLIE